MAWLRRAGRAVVAVVRWVLSHTRERLSPRGRVVFDWITGLVLIAIGVIGGFVPILQGWVFLLAGLAILSKHSPLARRWFERVRQMGREARDKLREKSGKSK
jgi:uncharacterized membrane protein YbaN (DUF454 family)